MTASTPSTSECSTTVLLNTFLILNKRHHVMYHSKTVSIYLFSIE